MAIHIPGLTIYDEELQKGILRIVDRDVKRWISAGNKAQKELRTKYTIDWFVGKDHESHTMVDALEFKHKMVQKKGIISLYFTSYVNMGRFAITTAFNDPSIYRWKAKYGANIDPAEYLLDLQWNQGIHGLPQEWSHPNKRFHQTEDNPPWINPYFNQGIPMKDYMREAFEKEWVSTVYKYRKI